MSDAGAYLLGMHQEEMDRLGRQHHAWRVPTENVWRLAGIRPGQTVVDLGCGPGFCSIGLSQRVGPRGHVVAVDGSPTATARVMARARAAGLSNVEVVTADALDFDASRWRVDAVFSRWLFCFLREPARVVNRLASALPSGATVAVMDYWHYRAIRTEPLTPLFTKVFQAVYDSFAAAGGSLDIAGTLPALFRAAGLEVTHVVPLTQIGRAGSECWRWVGDFQDSYLPSLVQKGYLTMTEVEDYQAWWRDQERNPDAFLYAPPILGIVGIKK
jgi:SAM-dependent methyltransferase